MIEQVYIHTAAIEAQLIADNTSIFTAPVVVTHCAPVAMETHLYSALVLVLSTNQTNVSACTVGIHTCRHIVSYNYILVRECKKSIENNFLDATCECSI